MAEINEATFIDELLKDIPEFRKIHEENKEEHAIGVDTIFWDLRCFAEHCQKRNDQKMLKKIAEFILRCDTESKDNVQNAVWVSFFENMNDETIEAIGKYLPKKYYKGVQKYIKEFEEKYGGWKPNKNPKQRTKVWFMLLALLVILFLIVFSRSNSFSVFLSFSQATA